MKVADWELKLWSLRSQYGFLLTGGSRECRQWTGENNTFKNFLSTSSTIASVSKHSLTKLYLHILRIKKSIGRVLKPTKEYKIIIFHIYANLHFFLHTKKSKKTMFYLSVRAACAIFTFKRFHNSRVSCTAAFIVPCCEKLVI